MKKRYTIFIRKRYWGTIEKVADSMDYTIREGNYEKLGVQKKDDAVIFTFEGEKEENCSILFYGKKQNLSAKF